MKKRIFDSNSILSKTVAAVVLLTAVFLTGCPARPPVDNENNSISTVKPQKKENYPMAGAYGEHTNLEYDITPYKIYKDYKINSQNLSVSKSELKVYSIKRLDKISFESDMSIRGGFQRNSFEIVRCDVFETWRRENGLDITGYAPDGTMSIGYDYPYADGGKMRATIMIDVYKDPSDKFIVVTNCTDHKVICEFFGGKGSGKPTPTPVPTSCAIADYCDIPSKQYEIFMKKIDEIEASDPGKYTYNFTAVIDNESDRYYFIMSAHYEFKKMFFVVLNGELKQLEELPYNAHPGIADGRTYKEIKSLPYLVDTKSFNHTEFDEYGRSNIDSHTPIASKLKDGEYFGEMIGVSEDGKSVMFKVGKPVVMSCDKLKTLSPGDKVGYRDLVLDHKEGYFFYLKSASMIYLNSPYCERYSNFKGETDKAFLRANAENWVEDTVIVIVPVTNLCRVFDNTEYSKHYDELPENWLEKGSLLTNTRFLKALKEKVIGTKSNNGWYSVSFPVTSLIIKNGEATLIECHSDYSLM